MKLLISIIVSMTLGLSIDAQQNSRPFNFPIASPPSFIQTPTERISYTLLHYWDNFPFMDTRISTNGETFEQHFADYVYFLSNATQEEVRESITQTLTNASKAKVATLKTFVNLYEKYLYDANSPMRNEELFIPVLQFVIASPLYKNSDKIRPTHQLKLALRNRVGEIATDFSVTLISGKQVKLTQIHATYTLLYFNNPDCHDCKRVKKHLEQSPIFTQLINQKKLMIFSIYSDEAVDVWRKTSYPKQWLNGFDANQTIQNQSLYDLKAIPTLYLLDKNKKVLLKDAAVEKIEQYLKQ